MSGSDARSSAGLPGWRVVVVVFLRAIAIAKSSSRRGERGVGNGFQFASTNLVWELGLVLWVLIGWQFTLAEYLGGIVMIVLMSLLLRLFVNRQLEDRRAITPARPIRPSAPHCRRGAVLARTADSTRRGQTSRTTSAATADAVEGDHDRVPAPGFVAQFGNGIFEHLFIRHAPAPLPTIENVIIGRSSPCSALCAQSATSLGRCCGPWDLVRRGAGVSVRRPDRAADLTIYRKYYGTKFTLRITALMFTTMVLAALIVDGIFSALD